MKLLSYFCLIFILLQCVDENILNLPIPSIPFSLGETLFILLGFYNLKIKEKRFNSVIVCFIIINISGLIASFLNEDFSTDLSRSIGILILLIASIGWSNLWSKKEFITALNIFFIVNFIYWSVYLIPKTYVAGTFISYGELFAADGSITNHHIIGLAISISSLYLLIRFFISKKQISKFGFGFIIITFILLVLTESRSNLLVYIFLVFLIFIYLNKTSFKAIFFVGLVGVSMLFTFNYLFSNQERISERFSLESEYQTNTNVSRFEIYKNFPKELLSNPLGKGAIGGTKILLFGSEDKNLHNQYLTFSLQGGVLAFIAALYFFGRIIFLIRNGGHLMINFSSSISAVFFLVIAFWITLLTIDFGGLFYQIILSLTIYLYDIAKYNKILKL
jgi:hypothetical protein